MPVYWFNRGAGSEREQVIFSGDPLSPQNKKFLEEHEMAVFKFGAQGGYGPEVSEEEIVRAMMALRANAMTHDAPSPQLTQMLLDFVNLRITPVVQTRGTLGEGDLAPARRHRRGHGRRRRRLLQRRAHARRRGAEEGGPQAAAALRRRRQRPDQLQRLRHGPGGVCGL